MEALVHGSGVGTGTRGKKRGRLGGGPQKKKGLVLYKLSNIGWAGFDETI